MTIILQENVTMAARKRREWTKTDVRELKSLAKKVQARQIARKLRAAEGVRARNFTRHATASPPEQVISDASFKKQGGRRQMALLLAVLDFALPSKAYEIEKVERSADGAFGR